MKVLTIVAMLLVAPVSEANAQVRTRSKVGWTVIGAGVATFASAFNYQRTCDGTMVNIETTSSPTAHYCVEESYRDVSVHPAGTDASLARPRLRWIGLATMGAGITIWKWPHATSPIAPTIQIQPTGVQVTSRVTWGRR